MKNQRAKYDSEINYVDEKIKRLYKRFDWAEKNNLVESHPQLLKRFLSRLIQFEKKSRRFTSQTVDMKLDQKKKDELKSLGYVQ